MGTERDDQGMRLEAAIDDWVAEKLAASPEWSRGQWRSILALLEVEEPK
ncbi:hypothetical protein [Streptomyces atratus]